MPRSAPARYVLNRSHPLSEGLVACFVPDGRAGMRDLVRGVRLASVGSAKIVSNVAGNAADCNAAPRGYQITAPQHLKYNYPITIVWAGVPLQTMASARLFGIDLNNTGAAPYVSYTLGTNGSGVFNSDYGNSASFTTITGSTNSSAWVGKFVVAAVSIRVGGSTLYVNGKSEATGSVATNPTFTSTSQVSIGRFSNSSTSGQAQCNIGLMYNRVLSAAEHRALAQDPFQMLRPARLTAGFVPSGASWFPWRLKFTGTTTQGL